MILLVGDVEEPIRRDGDSARMIQSGGGVGHGPDVTTIVGKHLNAIGDRVGDENATGSIEAHAGRPLKL